MVAKKFNVEARFFCAKELNDWLMEREGGRSHYLRQLCEWARSEGVEFETKTITVLKARE